MICQTGRYILTIGSSNLITVGDKITPQMDLRESVLSQQFLLTDILKEAFLLKRDAAL